jgi:hypothetical protein
LLRIIKFASAFLGVAAFIFVLVFGLNRSSFETLFDNREGLAEGSEWVEKTYSLKGLTGYIGEHPGMVSIASVALEDPGSAIMYQEDTPRTMGTLSNLFLFIAYADAFERGYAIPDERLDWEEISRFQLPGIGENNHRNTYRTGRSSGLIERDGTLSLGNALQLLAKNSSLALSDYLLSRLDSGRLDDLFDRLSLEHTDKPVPFSGLLIITAPSIQGMSPPELLQHWKDEGRHGFEEAAYSATERFLNGEDRKMWSEVLKNKRLGLNFMEERDLLALYPATTATELVSVMQKIVEGELLSAAVSERVLDWIRYPMEEQAIRRNFSEYGALYDNRIGLLNGVDFGVSQYTGHTTVQAVLFDRMHISVWFHMSSNHMHQDFQQRLIWDPALIDAMKNEIARAAYE